MKTSDISKNAADIALKLKSEGEILTPAVSKGKKIASSFWGYEWCRRVALYSDYESRLPAGRSLLRAGGVIDLEILSGCVRAKTVSDMLYEQTIMIKTLSDEQLDTFSQICSGRIGALSDLVAGNLSEDVIEMICDESHGIFPEQSEIKFVCNCLDDSILCHHCAAILYGIGPRLDDEPSLFFKLRGIALDKIFDTQRLIGNTVSDVIDENVLADDDLGGVFGIVIDN